MIYKGGQEELKYFKDNNLLFYYDEYTLSFDNKDSQEKFFNLYYMNAYIDIKQNIFYNCFKKSNSLLINDDNKQKQFMCSFSFYDISVENINKQIQETSIVWCLERFIYPEKINSMKCYML